MLVSVGIIKHEVISVPSETKEGDVGTAVLYILFLHLLFRVDQRPFGESKLRELLIPAPASLTSLDVY